MPKFRGEAVMPLYRVAEKNSVTSINRSVVNVSDTITRKMEERFIPTKHKEMQVRASEQIIEQIDSFRPEETSSLKKV